MSAITYYRACKERGDEGVRVRERIWERHYGKFEKYDSGSNTSNKGIRAKLCDYRRFGR